MYKIYSGTGLLKIAIGHVDDNGKVYNHPDVEFGYAVGQIDIDGKIYANPYSKFEGAVGQVDRNGVIYSNGYSTLLSAVGQVASDGGFYKNPYSTCAEVPFGMAEQGCPRQYAGGAGYLLMRELFEAAATNEGEEFKKEVAADRRQDETQEAQSTVDTRSDRSGGVTAAFIFVIVALIYCIYQGLDLLFTTKSPYNLFGLLIIAIAAGGVFVLGKAGKKRRGK